MAVPKNILKALFALNVTFLLLLGFSYPYIEPGTGSYVAATLTLVAIGLMMVTILAVLFVQNRLSTETTA